MTQIISQNALASAGYAVGSTTLPNFDGAIGEWWFGASAAASLNAISGVAPTEVNAPNFADAYATLGFTSGGGTKGLTLDIPSTPAITWAALVRPVGGSAGYIASNLNSVSNAQLRLTIGNNASFGNGQTTGATDQSILPLPDPAKFNLIVGVGLLATPSRLFVVDDGVVTMDDGGAAYLPITRPAGVVTLGAVNDINNQGLFDLAAFAAWDDAKGSTFIDQLYPMWRAYAENLGLTVA